MTVPFEFGLQRHPSFSILMTFGSVVGGLICSISIAVGVDGSGTILESSITVGGIVGALMRSVSIPVDKTGSGSLLESSITTGFWQHSQPFELIWAGVVRATGALEATGAVRATGALEATGAVRATGLTAAGRLGA